MTIRRRFARRVVAKLRPLLRVRQGQVALNFLKRIRGVTFLVYHEVADTVSNCFPATLVVSATRFAQELAWIRQHFEAISIDEAFKRLANGRFPSHAVVLCFDDGYRGVLEHAYPLLERFRLPATLFLNSSFYEGSDVGLRLKLEWILKHYSWEALQKNIPGARDPVQFVALAKQPLSSSLRQSIDTLFRDAGGFSLTQLYLHKEDLRVMSPTLITVANHTKSHRWLPGLTVAEQEIEILESHAVLETLTHFRPYFALPFGTPESFDYATLELIKRHYDGKFLTAYGGVNTRTTRNGTLFNVLRNTVSEAKPKLAELLWLNHLMTLLAG
jgi:peptidoglycan/xylan/chitin deacetylase (PgdA/CDA1 family)